MPLRQGLPALCLEVLHVLLALHLLLVRHLLLLRLLQLLGASLRLLGASLRLRLLAESLLVAVYFLLTLRRRLGLALKLWRTLGERLLRLGHVRWPRLLT